MTLHKRIQVLNINVFACMKKKEAYDTNMPFRFCPSCGKRINEKQNYTGVKQ